MRYGRRRVISASSSRIRPRRAGVKPITERTSVVLPAPFRPRIPTMAARGISSDTPWRMWLSP